MAKGDAMTRWPELPLAPWRSTRDTLHLWTQMVGKTLLATCPPQNHWWHATLRVSATGLAAPPIVRDGHSYDIAFDFVDHELTVRRSDGRAMGMPLVPRTVRSFYEEYTALLDAIGLGVHFWTTPVEVPDPIRFDQDEIHREYDSGWAHTFWQVLRRCDLVFKGLADDFLGKQSPVHFFWGSFDLAVTRFSGRRAPRHPGGIPGLSDEVTREAYSHEVSSAGFWPGNDAFPRAAFYSYAYPEPPGFSGQAVTPPAYYDTGVSEFILPYDAVRQAADPEATLLDFLTRTYAAAADAAQWDRAALECRLGEPGRVRPVAQGSVTGSGAGQ